jgi:hypothetical protein
LAKIGEVLGLEANMYQLEDDLEFEREQWIELHDKYRDLLDRMLILDHCKRIFIFEAMIKNFGK